MSVDIRHLFDTKLPETFAQQPERATAINTVFLMQITGDGGGEWTVNASPSGPKVSQGVTGEQKATIAMRAEDFQKIYKSDSEMMPLYFAGKMKIEGDQMAGMQLSKLLAMCRN
ncbi:SCP2 sterol-binding domain-containing protein [Streptomyces griseoincarnatus]